MLDPIWGDKINNPKKDFGLEYSDIEFSSVEKNGKSVKLRGWYVPSSQKRRNLYVFRFSFFIF